MKDRLIEVLPAKKYYGPHATGVVVVVNGHPAFHGTSREAKLFVKGLEKGGIDHETLDD